MRFITEDNKDEVRLKLHFDKNGSAEIVGTSNHNNGEWIIGSFTAQGTFQPNSEGCRQLGITIDNTFNKAL